MLDIVFMGTPDFAKESLKALKESGYNIKAVITNQDKPKGRGMKVEMSPVKDFAIEAGIEKIYQPEKIKNNKEIIDEIKTIKPDLIVVVAYGKILPKEILEIPRLGCINVHASLLPKYRGAAPIQWAVINGDETTGVTTMYMDEGMDTGDMILKYETKIEPNETTGMLWNRLSILGANLLIETIEKIEKGTAKRERQGLDYTIAPMIRKEISKIDWENKTALEIKNLVRGLNPIMGAFTYVNDKKIKFWNVNVIKEEEIIKKYKDILNINLKDVPFGTIIISDSKLGLFIKTKKDYIEVIEIQGENAKKMQIKDFLRGNKIEVGTILK